MKNNNLSKLKKADHISKKTNKKISAEESLADDMKNKKASKTEPSNKKLDSEEFLADMKKKNIKGGNKKISSEKSLSDMKIINPKKGNVKLDSEKSLSENTKYIKGYEDFDRI